MKINYRKLDEFCEDLIDVGRTHGVKKEFSEYIGENLAEILENDVVIKMKRKGKAIFESLEDEFPPLSKLVPFTDTNYKYDIDKVKGRSILIFDDSIHTGRSVTQIIEHLKSYNCKIMVLNVLSLKETADRLRNEFPEPEVKFKIFKESSGKEYSDFYSRYMFGYLDLVNMSLEKDHYLIKLKIAPPIDEETLIGAINDFNPSKIENIVPKINGYKISCECPEIFTKVEKKRFKRIDELEMAKIRFFVKNTSKYSEINIAPIIIPSPFNHNDCKEDEGFCKSNQLTFIKVTAEGDKEVDIGKLDQDVKRTLQEFQCLCCIINYISKIFLGEFMGRFEGLLENLNCKVLEHKRYPPLPTEIVEIDRLSPDLLNLI